MLSLLVLSVDADSPSRRFAPAKTQPPIMYLQTSLLWLDVLRRLCETCWFSFFKQAHAFPKLKTAVLVGAPN